MINRRGLGKVLGLGTGAAAVSLIGPQGPQAAFATPGAYPRHRRSPPSRPARTAPFRG